MKNIGYKIIYCPNALVYHLGGGSLPQGNPRKTFLNFRNNLALITKNYHYGRLGKLLAIRFMLDVVAMMHFAIKGEINNAISVLRALFDFYKQYPDWMKKRKALTALMNNPNTNGYYRHSIIKDFFILKHKVYHALRHD
jgi:hypothetical protein